MSDHEEQQNNSEPLAPEIERNVVIEENTAAEDDLEAAPQAEETPAEVKDPAESDVRKSVPNSEFDTVVISGGGAKGFGALGALQYAVDNHLLNHVSTYIGTSVGAIISYLIAIGYSPVEIVVYVCTHQLMEKLSHFNILSMMNGDGATSFSPISEQLERMTIAKIGKLLTLGALKERFGKTLICVTHNFTTDQTEYLGPDTHPDMPCLVACRMSANLPFVFEQYRYMDCRYIDGGISDNFAIDLGDQQGQKVLGILLRARRNDISETHGGELKMLEDIYRLLFTPINQAIDYKLSQISERCTIVTITTGINTKAFNFAISSPVKLEMFSSGYQDAANILD